MPEQTDATLIGATPLPVDRTLPDHPSRSPRRGLRTLAREFLLIVVGVLTALLLENWNAQRSQQQLEVEYLTALSADLRAHLAQYDDMRSTLARHKAWTTTIWGWASGTPPEQPSEEVLLWIKLGGQIHLNMRFQDGAYQDLINSGKLAIIRNRQLREALLDYHTRLARWGVLFDAQGLKVSDRYAAAVAEVIPPELAWRAATGADLSSVDLSPVMAAYRRRPQVRSALVALIESHHFRDGILETNRAHAAELLNRLEAELAR